MKAVFTLIAIFIFSVGYAQSNLTVKAFAKTASFKARLIQDPGLLPHCGIWAGNVSLKFKVIDTNQLGNTEEICEVFFFCPGDFYGNDFFKKDNLFYITATSMTSVDWGNLFNKEKSNKEILNKEAWLCKTITKTL